MMRTRSLAISLAVTMLLAWTTSIALGQGPGGGTNVRSTLTVLPVSGRAGSTVDVATTLVASDIHVPIVGAQISYYVDGSPVAIVTTDGAGRATAACAVPSYAPAGPLSVRAEFSGSTGIDGSTGLGSIAVTATTRVWVRNITSRVVRRTRLTAVLQETPAYRAVAGRTLQFKVDGVAIGSGVTGDPEFPGLAAVIWDVPDGMSVGAHSIGVTFAGDQYCAPSSGSGALTIQKSDSRIWTCSKTGAPGAIVGLLGFAFRTDDSAAIVGRSLSFTIDGTDVGSAVTGSTVPGRADITWTVPDAAPATASEIGVSFAGDGAYNPSSATATLMMLPGETFTWAGSRTAWAGSPVTVKAIVRRYAGYLPREGKSVTFKVDGVMAGTSQTGADGWASISYSVPSGLGVGIYQISAEFAGDQDDMPSSAVGELNVVK